MVANMLSFYKHGTVDTWAGFKYTGVEERYQIAHQSIKQCIHQLSHLKRVWVDVLPASNYSKSIGTF